MLRPMYEPIPVPLTAATTTRGRIEVLADRVTFELGSTDGDTGEFDVAVASLIGTAATAALDQRLPLVGTLVTTGVDVDAGIAATHAWGGAAKALVECSGVVPTILIVPGPAVSGSALLLGLVDIVVMTSDAHAFVSGPRMVTDYTGIPVDTSGLGGTSIHGLRSGVATFVVESADAARDVVNDLIDVLPANNARLAPRVDPIAPDPDLASSLTSTIPDSPTGSYDVRNVIGGIVDDDSFIEFRRDWAANLVTGVAHIDGWLVGIVANQPQVLAGTLDIAASQKGGGFVSFCDAFAIPLLTLVDTPGFQPGKDLEWRGMIRHGAELAFAYARATVPRISLTLRKSYGGAYIVMDSKNMGNDIALAWPTAEIAVMGAKGAVEILHRREGPERRAEIELDYAERLLNPWRAAERGSVDAVIEPTATRHAVADSLAMLSSKREDQVVRRHSNTPL